MLADPKLRPLMDDRQTRILENVRKQRSEPSEAQGALVMEIKAELEEKAEEEKPKRSYAEVHGFFSRRAMQERLEDLERVRADGPMWYLDERIQALKDRLAAMDGPEPEPLPIRRAMPPSEARGSVQDAQAAQRDAQERLEGPPLLPARVAQPRVVVPKARKPGLGAIAAMRAAWAIPEWRLAIALLPLRVSKPATDRELACWRAMGRTPSGLLPSLQPQERGVKRSAYPFREGEPRSPSYLPT